MIDQAALITHHGRFLTTWDTLIDKAWSLSSAFINITIIVISQRFENKNNSQPNGAFYFMHSVGEINKVQSQIN